MSYEIYYDRAFIKIPAGMVGNSTGMDLFIPIVCSGSNNCFEVTYKGREIPEKYWNALNYPTKGTFLFSEPELRDWAKKFDACSTERHKSRYRCFQQGEMERWLINGMKSAQTLEVYLENGNSFCVNNWTDWENQKYYYPRTSAELLNTLDSLKDIKKLSIGFENRDVRRPKTYKPRARHERRKIPSFYVLYKEGCGSFYKLTRYGYKYSLYQDGGKKYLSEKDAQKYLKKYEDRLTGFVPVKIEKEAYV